MASLGVGWWLIESGLFRSVVDHILPLSLVAEVLAGVLYTSFLTAPVAVVMLIMLAADHHPVLVALLAGIGAMLGDLVMVKLFKDKTVKQINPLSYPLQKIVRVLKSFKLEFLLPLLGAIVIASPLPDELGLMLFGASRLRYYELMILTYILNTAGMLVIVLPANLLQ